MKAKLTKRGKLILRLGNKMSKKDFEKALFVTSIRNSREDIKLSEIVRIYASNGLSYFVMANTKIINDETYVYA